jgi:hypothetical protein
MTFSGASHIRRQYLHTEAVFVFAAPMDHLSAAFRRAPICSAVTIIPSFDKETPT